MQGYQSDMIKGGGRLQIFLRIASGGMLCVFFILCCAIPAYYSTRAAAEREHAALAPGAAERAEVKKTAGGAKVADDPGVYTRDGYGDVYSIVYFYMTVRRGNAAENSDTPWDELSKHSTLEYTALGVDRDRVECILQEGDANGPVEGMFGYGASVPNGVVNIRGNTTSEEPHKSYKIYLKKGWLWRGQQNINFNKHVYDKLRFRNKLMFDLMRDIPGMISMRTQFVHLYVKDETEIYGQYGDDSLNFVDYGLFTQIENPNKTYLRNHGLDTNGQLYKASMFEFWRYENDLRLVDDPDFDLQNFNSVMKSKVNNDHSKLIGMLDDLNKPDYPIDLFFEKYFDRENYFTWLAFVILTGDIDSTNRNFLLYSPQNSEKWYFITWDADWSFMRRERVYVHNEEYVQENDYGIQNYWIIYFHRRVMANNEYRTLLDAYVEKLMPYLSREILEQRVARYKEAIHEILLCDADVEVLRLHGSRVYQDIEYESVYDLLADTLPNEVVFSYDLYKRSLYEIMNFYMSLPEKTDTGYRFMWDAAYTYEPAKIKYEFKLASDLDFQNILYEQRDITVLSISIDGLRLPSGKYFFRVMAYDDAGRETYSSEYTVDNDHKKYPGVHAFNVDETGETFY